jgi:hypothetical protein
MPLRVPVRHAVIQRKRARLDGMKISKPFPSPATAKRRKAGGFAVVKFPDKNN